MPSQLAVVHALPPVQSDAVTQQAPLGAWAHCAAWQVSAVQALRSSHWNPNVQQLAVGVLTQRFCALHVWVTHGSLLTQSAVVVQQLGVGTCAQLLPRHWSSVQVTPSSQSAAVSQQLAVGVWLQVPPPQVSTVQDRPSSQSAVVVQQLGVRACEHCPPTAQASTEHVSPSTHCVFLTQLGYSG